MSEAARVIFDADSTGSWNMAVDQALLMSAENENRATLRFYGWSEPTLSLGYFQKHEDRKKHLESAGCSMVRRRSGGGAIMHDQELTYSLALPSTNRWSKQNGQLYDLIHEQIIGVLARNGLVAHLFRDLQQTLEPVDAAIASQPLNKDLSEDLSNDRQEAWPLPFVSSDAFLCFQRRTSGDIVMDGFKVVGSAQRRLKHSLLQHGSVLLGRSEFARDLPGVSDLGGSLKMNRDELARALMVDFESKLNFEFSGDGLDEREKALAVEIEETVFKCSQWNEKR